MKLDKENIAQIRIAFQQMQNKEDLLHLLNEVKPHLYGKMTVPFEMKQLTWYSNPKINKKSYSAFEIKKKSGTQRKIHAPIKGLKALQRTLAIILQCVYEPNHSTTGFVLDKSIVDNAKIHTGNNYVYNLDLKDFFSSIDQARIWKTMQLKPFNLNRSSSVVPKFVKWDDFKEEFLKSDELVRFIKGKGRMFTNTPLGTIYISNSFDIKKEKYILFGNSNLKSKNGNSLDGTLWLVNKIPSSDRLELANMIAAICCTEIEVDRRNENGEWEKVQRNVLPQGAPTSPVLSNIVCQKLDYLLSGVAKRFGLKYSRYADDITFSSNHNVYQSDSEFLIELHRIIKEQNFHIKESKTRLQKDGYRKEVTGLLVNENVNVQSRYIKQIRMWLYYWERYGYERAEGFFLQQYFIDKGNVLKGKPNMANVIGGKLNYLKMVKGSKNLLFIKLSNRYAALTNKEPKDNFSRVNHLNTVLIKVLENGIDDAMKFYKKQ